MCATVRGSLLQNVRSEWYGCRGSEAEELAEVARFWTRNAVGVRIAREKLRCADFVNLKNNRIDRQIQYIMGLVRLILESGSPYVMATSMVL